MRDLVRETSLDPDDFVYPLFVRQGDGIKTEIASMPGNYHFSVDRLVEEVGQAREDGVRSVLLFGIPERKDDQGSEAWDDAAAVQSAVRRLKSDFSDLIVITDVCLCEYTSHGHCGVVEDGRVVNDKTLELLTRTALSHARAGADVVAPSDMMDGRIAVIREALESTGHVNTRILAYAAKYASSFYGPFRDAVGSADNLGGGNKYSYQMDPANSNEALHEVALNIDEGADMVMIKPGLPYLDIVRRVSEELQFPTFVYQVSGEYAMLKAAGQNGWIDERACVLEALLSIKRAGANGILTYYAKSAAAWLQEK